jgi:hypothetical protein
MEVNGGKWRQMEANGGKWRQMEANGGKWRQMEANGKRTSVIGRGTNTRAIRPSAHLPYEEISY